MRPKSTENKNQCGNKAEEKRVFCSEKLTVKFDHSAQQMQADLF